MSSPSPIDAFLEEKGVLILDGGLATELEARGFDLDDPLWSARLLIEEPAAIQAVHRDYLEAGADCIITASYQATVAGFLSRGKSEQQAIDLLRKSVELALSVRERFWAEEKNRKDRLRPLVAASIGPYGAYLANGAEFTGRYDFDREELVRFHRRRWHVLADSGADLLACETIPSGAEALALADLIRETPKLYAWLSFSCRDGEHISDGTPIAECARQVSSCSGIVAIGVNCTAPRFVPRLLAALREVTDKPLLAYPNSGERYDTSARRWSGESDPEGFGVASRLWHASGARLLGGCCRTGPDHIREIRRSLAPIAA